MPHNLCIHGKADVKRYVASLPSANQDRLLAIFIDDQFFLVECQIVSQLGGTITERCLRDLLCAGLERGATSFILVHNPLTFEVQVGPADFTTAKRLHFLARELGLQLLDHLIVTSEEVVSVAPPSRSTLIESSPNRFTFSRR
ncbi:MAG: JAB domain-containing protein [Sphingomicrobium sp.]